MSKIKILLPRFMSALAACLRAVRRADIFSIDLQECQIFYISMPSVWEYQNSTNTKNMLTAGLAVGIKKCTGTVKNVP